MPIIRENIKAGAKKIGERAKAVAREAGPAVVRTVEKGARIAGNAVKADIRNTINRQVFYGAPEETDFFPGYKVEPSGQDHDFAWGSGLALLSAGFTLACFHITIFSFAGTVGLWLALGLLPGYLAFRKFARVYNTNY